MTFSDISIGKGNNLSIAKAALIYYFEEYSGTLLSYGHLDSMHRIVEIAGAEQKGFFTLSQVTSRLRSSPYWENQLSIGHYRGTRRGSGDALLFKPSQEGSEYYEKHLKTEKSKPCKKP